MPYNGQNPSNVGPDEFSERDRRMALTMLEEARGGRPVSAAGMLRLAHLEASGSSQQAPYFLREIGAVAGELAIDLPRGESGLVNTHDYDNAMGTLWRWQGIAQSEG